MSGIDEFHVWIDYQNMQSFAYLLVFWAIACCLYASGKIGQKIHDKTYRFLTGFDIRHKYSTGLAWVAGQSILLASLIACFYGAMAFSYSDESLKNIKARNTVEKILSFPDDKRPAVAMEWLKEEASWPIWK